MKTRKEWLETGWSPYPSLPSTSTDISNWKEDLALEKWWCGRIERRSDGSFLTNDQVEVAFEWAENCILQGHRPSPLQKEWIANGDVVALRFKKSSPLAIAIEVILLAPCLEDVDFALGFPAASARNWAKYIEALRTFFCERHFIEVRTPTLLPSPGTEPFLQSFTTELVSSGHRKCLHLPTSPEFSLKKFLCSGYSRIFELKECFRNGEWSETHRPEFLMLEWYRSFADLDAIAEDLNELLPFLSLKLNLPVAKPLRTVSVSELFLQYYDFELKPTTSASDLRILCKNLDLRPTADDDWSDLFFKCFLFKIEPDLGVEGPILVRRYPAPLAALARLDEEGWADRMELYWRGLELANGFNELNDPEKNRERFAADREQKIHLGLPPFPVDEQLLQALKKGMPPSAGIALGVERLFMALFEIKNISATRALSDLEP